MIHKIVFVQDEARCALQLLLTFMLLFSIF